VHAAVRDGLGEFAYCNDMPLDDVRIVGGLDVERLESPRPESRPRPFGGGIDSLSASSS